MKLVHKSPQRCLLMMKYLAMVCTQCFVFFCCFFSPGFSDYDIKRYGDTYNLKVPRKAEALEFTPEYSRDVIVLWKRDDIPPIVESRRKVRGGVFVIYNLTQEDSGKYIMRDKIRLPQTINNLRVKGKLSYKTCTA